MTRPISSLVSQARELVRIIPRTARIVLAAFMVAAALMAVYATLSAKTSALRLHVQHSLRSAQLAVYVDDELAYSTQLAGVPRKRLGFINDGVQGSLTQVVPVSPGAHVIRVRFTSDEGGTQEQPISGDFAKNGGRNLAINARRNSLTLAWQSEARAFADSPSGSSWFSHYAASFLLTIAGSIISAITGFALRELPKQLGDRATEAEKAQSAAAGQ
jgi:hypothetical protein